MKRSIETNEQIFKDALPKITKLDEEQRMQEIKAQREAIRMESIT